jgi:uncharacterized repeat protein (TIGR01451 family)
LKLLSMWTWTRDFKTQIKIAIVMGASLFLLCACGKSAHPTLTPTDTPLPKRTAAPPITTPFAPTDAALPTPSPSTEAGPPSAADLAIQVQGPVQVVSGETTTYTLTVHNHGPGLATSVVLTDVLPKGVIPVWTQAVQPVCGRQERGVNCDVGDLRAGDAVNVTLDLSVGGTEALITDTQLAGVTLDMSAPTCAMNQDSAQPYVTCRLTDLQPGADVQMRIGVGVDTGTTSLRLPSLAHTATVTANETDPNRSNNRVASAMMVSAARSAPSQVEEPVAVTAIPTTTDLVVQADGPSSVIAGQPFTYTFTIANRGALDATGIYFENAVPPATTLNAYAPGLPLCEQRDDALTCTLYDPDSGETVTFTLAITGHAGQPMIIELDPLMPGWPICTVLKERTFLHIVQCELGALKSGQATHVQLALTVEGTQERMTPNTAFVSANETDLNPLDNTNTTTVTVRVRADLVLWSAVSGPALAGQTLSYTLTVANLGPSDAADVVLADTLPMGTSLVSAVPSQGEDCQIEQEDTVPHVICSLGRLNGGEAATIAIVVAVDESVTPALTETIVHSARVVAEQVDPNPGNNELEEHIPVGAGVED